MRRVIPNGTTHTESCPHCDATSDGVTTPPDVGDGTTVTLRVGGVPLPRLLPSLQASISLGRSASATA